MPAARLTNEEFYRLRRECQDMAEFATKSGYTIGAAQTRAHDVKKWAATHGLPWPKLGRTKKVNAPPSDGLLSLLAADEGITLEQLKARLAGEATKTSSPENHEAPAAPPQSNLKPSDADTPRMKAMGEARAELGEVMTKLSDAARLIEDVTQNKMRVEEEELVGAT